MRAPTLRDSGPFTASTCGAIIPHEARCVPTSVSTPFDGQSPSSSVSEGGLAATVNETISKLKGVVGSLLGGKESKSGGAAGGGGTKAKKSSKRKSNSSNSGGFTEAFEAKYGKR